MMPGGGREGCQSLTFSLNFTKLLRTGTPRARFRNVRQDVSHFEKDQRAAVRRILNLGGAEFGRGSCVL